MGGFEESICVPVRRHLERPVRLPSVGEWSLGQDGGAPSLCLTVPAKALCSNLQTNAAAAPFFLLCFGYWHWRATGLEPTLRLDVTGDGPSSGNALLHYRRAWIALEALEYALGDRLQVSGAPETRWPETPTLNAPLAEREVANISSGGREHRIETLLCREISLAASFSDEITPIAGFRRQLPLGIFDGPVSKKAQWTPGGGAQADLWATSPDSRTFHLFELKVSGNEQVGILPELLTYAWILHRARTGFSSDRMMVGGGPGVTAARDAERLKAWTLAPQVHPLLLNQGRSPLEWVAEGLQGALDLGMIFYRESGPEGILAWEPGRTWIPRR